MQYDHTLSEKKNWMKNINFSWRKSIFKIWDWKILEIFPDKKSKFWNFHFLNWLFEEKNRLFFISKNICRDHFFFSKKNLRKINLKNENFEISKKVRKIFRKSSNFFFDQFFFRRNFFRKNIFCSPISIPNFPKIPKIALRKLCGQLNAGGTG